LQSIRLVVPPLSLLRANHKLKIHLSGVQKQALPKKNEEIIIMMMRYE
jgi:hypothetical protein